MRPPAPQAAKAGRHSFAAQQGSRSSPRCDRSRIQRGVESKQACSRHGTHSARGRWRGEAPRAASRSPRHATGAAQAEKLVKDWQVRVGSRCRAARHKWRAVSEAGWPHMSRICNHQAPRLLRGIFWLAVAACAKPSGFLHLDQTAQHVVWPLTIMWSLPPLRFQ